MHKRRFILVINMILHSTELKRTMNGLVSVTHKQMAECPSLTRRLAPSESSVLDSLSSVMHHWARNISALESLCDSQLGRYLQMTSQLRTAMQLNNRHLVDTMASFKVNPTLGVYIYSSHDLIALNIQ